MERAGGRARRRRLLLREVVNWLNLSTPAGLALARWGADGPRRAERGMWVARGYRLPFPVAPAFTMGNVVLVRSRSVNANPLAGISAQLLAHEESHATQYAWCGGVLMPAFYLAASGWSWLRTGDFASRNVFERGAGLVAGGYPENPVRPLLWRPLLWRPQIGQRPPGALNRRGPALG